MQLKLADDFTIVSLKIAEVGIEIGTLKVEKRVLYIEISYLFGRVTFEWGDK